MKRTHCIGERHVKRDSRDSFSAALSFTGVGKDFFHRFDILEIQVILRYFFGNT
jgi:hypothetical protein